MLLNCPSKSSLWWRAGAINTFHSQSIQPVFDRATVQNGAGSGLMSCITLFNSSIGHSVFCSMLLVVTLLVEMHSFSDNKATVTLIIKSSSTRNNPWSKFHAVDGLTLVQLCYSMKIITSMIGQFRFQNIACIGYLCNYCADDKKIINKSPQQRRIYELKINESE